MTSLREPDPLDAAPLLAVLGPTAVGKSALALELAERADAEILSLDSMLVYRGLDVGTAKPTAAERARVPHHLLDLVDPPERFDVLRYLDDARRAVADVLARGRRPLFVGGTAFYYRALVHGLFEGPPVDPELRARFEARADAEGLAALHDELRRVDPDSAARIHPNDRKRVVRALEVFEQVGEPLSARQREWGWGDDRPPPGRARRVVALRRPAEELEERIRARTEEMLAAGWIDEVRAVQGGPGFGPTSIQALGYREVLAHLAGELDQDELRERIALRTRQFARRQRTWLRRFDELHWVDVDRPDAVDVCLAHLTGRGEVEAGA
jgi:tRNA dimethylallyltransferase